MKQWIVLLFLLTQGIAFGADEADLDDIEASPDHPKYSLLKPLWGVQIGGGALHSSTSSSGLIGRPLTLQIEIQPTFLQNFGVVSLGPMVGSFFSPTTFYGGGMIRYQARFIPEQFIVPMVGYEYMMPFSLSTTPASIDLASGTISGTTATSGVVLGGWIFLNTLEPSAGSHFFVNHGVLRSYLTAEYRSWFNGALTFWHFGLRIEY